MFCRISLLAVLCVAFLLPGCSQGPEADEIACLKNAVEGLGARPFVITGVSKYKKCTLYFCTKQKEELLLGQDLKDVGDQICVAVPVPPDNKMVAFGRKNGCRYSGKFSFDPSPDYSGYVSLGDAPIKAGPSIGLLGTISGWPNFDTSDFTDDDWCFVVEFE